MVNKVLCLILGHDDTDATWNSDELFQTKLYCSRCGWRTQDRERDEIMSEAKSILLLAGLAALIGLCLWRWIYVIKRMDLQF